MEASKYCTSCGAPAAGNKFCTHCGGKLVAKEQPEGAPTEEAVAGQAGGIATAVREAQAPPGRKAYRV